MAAFRKSTYGISLTACTKARRDLQIRRALVFVFAYVFIPKPVLTFGRDALPLAEARDRAALDGGASQLVEAQAVAEQAEQT